MKIIAKDGKTIAEADASIENIILNVRPDKTASIEIVSGGVRYTVAQYDDYRYAFGVMMNKIEYLSEERDNIDAVLNFQQNLVTSGDGQ